MVEESPEEVSDRQQIKRYSLEQLYAIGINWKKIKEDVYLTLLQMKLLTKTLDVAKIRDHQAQLTILTEAEELRRNYALDEYLMKVVEHYEQGVDTERLCPPPEKWVCVEIPDEPEPCVPLTVPVAIPVTTQSQAEFDRIRKEVLAKANGVRIRCNELREIHKRQFSPRTPKKQQQTAPQPQSLPQPSFPHGQPNPLPQSLPQPMFPQGQMPPQPAQGPQPMPQHFIDGRPPANMFNPYSHGPQYMRQNMPPMPYPYYNYPQQQQMMMQNYPMQPQSPMMSQQFFPQPPNPPTHNQSFPQPLERSRTHSESTNCTQPSIPDGSIKPHQLQIKGSPLTEANILVLSLLSLAPQERDEFIMKEAKKRGLIKKKKRDHDQLAISHKYREIFPKIQTYARERVTKSPPTDKALEAEIAALIAKSSESTAAAVGAKNNPQHTFEQLVTMLVNDVDNLDDLDRIKYALPLEKKADKKFSEKERDELVQELVERLVADGKGHVHTSDIRIHAKSYQKAFVSDIEAADVYISNPVLRRNALHGDIVEVYVHHTAVIDPSEIDPLDPEVEESKPQKLGFVTKIIEARNSRMCVGTLEPFRKDVIKQGCIKFIPRDPRMPTIKIPKQNWPNALLVKHPIDVENVLYQAEILAWRKQTPMGNIVKSFGACGELVAETEALLGELNVIPYPEEVIDKYAKMEFTIPEKEFEYREDLRKQCVFTIDPSTARDLDDAMSVRKLENGNYEIGVHISDVTYFVEENSFLDEIVKEKATTIYMVDNVYHMLPKPLCFMCSLLPGEDKLAFSVIWEMTADGSIVKKRFTRSVIHSCAQLAYEDAQDIIDQPDAPEPEEFPRIFGGHTFDEIRDAVKVLHGIAQNLRKKRLDNGAIKIDRPKLWFDLDPKTRKPIQYGICEQKESHRLIEEFMLLANISVAEFINSKFPTTSILRGHSPPNNNSLTNLEATLKRFGYALTGRDSAKLRDSMEQLIADSESPEATRAVLNVLLSKPMQRARYFCNGAVESERDFYHFGLATAIYTHFTSPIRRYADIMVHRSLSAALDYTAESLRSVDELQLLAVKSNEQKWTAKVAGQQCVQLYFRHYLNEMGSIKMKAGVIAIGEHSIEVVLVETDDCIKIWYKQLDSSISVVSTFEKSEAKPTHVNLVFPGRDPFKVTLFTELTVEVSVYKDKLVINNILPPA